MLTDTNRNSLNLSLLLLLSLCLHLLLQLAIRLALELVRATNGNVLGTEVTEEVLEDVLDEPATTVIEDHEHGEGHLEISGERNQAQLLVQLGDELGSTGERDTGGSDETPVHSLVLTNRLAEGTALVVDREGGDLLDQLEKVDSTVQEGGFEFALKIDIG